MKRIKQQLPILFTFLLIIGLAGCGDASQNATEKLDEANTEAVKDMKDMYDNLDNSMEQVQKKTEDLEKALDDLKDVFEN